MVKESKLNPVCKKEPLDCFGLVNGKCAILRNTDFGDRECPFYKPAERPKPKETEDDIGDYCY